MPNSCCAKVGPGAGAFLLLCQVPNTSYALDHMRPDMLLLMVLGGALVMWDSIAASQEWISEQLPAVMNYPLSTILDNMLAANAANVFAGQADPCAAGSALDWGAIGLAHVHALSGACFAIGLRFAGTSNAAAEALLRQHLLQLLHAKRRAPGGPNDQSIAPAMAAAAAAAATGTRATGVGIGYSSSALSVGKVDKQAIENSMCVVLLSLSLVMAGSGHLPTFRLIQVGHKQLTVACAVLHTLNSSQSNPVHIRWPPSALPGVLIAVAFCYLG